MLLETYLAKPDPLILDFMAFGKVGVQQNLAIPAVNRLTQSRNVSVVKVLSCVGFVFCWWWWWEILGVFCLCFLPCSLLDLSSQVMFLKIKTIHPLWYCISYLKFCLNLFPMPDSWAVSVTCYVPFSEQPNLVPTISGLSSPKS